MKFFLRQNRELKKAAFSKRKMNLNLLTLDIGRDFEMASHDCFTSRQVVWFEPCFKALLQEARVHNYL
jgi:hypothetical protein